MTTPTTGLPPQGHLTVATSCTCFSNYCSVIVITFIITAIIIILIFNFFIIINVTIVIIIVIIIFHYCYSYHHHYTNCYYHHHHYYYYYYDYYLSPFTLCFRFNSLIINSCHVTCCGVLTAVQLISSLLCPTFNYMLMNCIICIFYQLFICGTQSASLFRHKFFNCIN